VSEPEAPLLLTCARVDQTVACYRTGGRCQWRVHDRARPVPCTKASTAILRCFQSCKHALIAAFTCHQWSTSPELRRRRLVCVLRTPWLRTHVNTFNNTHCCQALDASCTELYQSPSRVFGKVPHGFPNPCAQSCVPQQASACMFVVFD
jgi:hypothetical protein